MKKLNNATNTTMFIKVIQGGGSVEPRLLSKTALNVMQTNLSI